ncbi:MBL fold metallo-hydrolase [Bacillus spongiae]|uniref:MBL fold metallo-hydrolase n=1 Tax=Bacillus spongiae TaxID=2683610 RepID=A0ABU8HKF7_9BACI
MIQYKSRNLTVFQSSLYMTTSAIIHTDEVIIMTDPNWLPNEVERIRNYVNSIKGDKQLYIIYTHSDYDHVIGSGAFPDAKVIATEELKNSSQKGEIVKKIHAFDQGYYLHRNYEPEYPSVDIAVANDGETLNLGTISLTFYKAPGHTKDGLFTVIEPYGIFLTGDYLSDIEFPFIFSSYKDYIKTMKKAEEILRIHNIKVHVPGHGTTTEEPTEIRNRIDFSKFYLKELKKDGEALENLCLKKYPFYEGMKNIHFDNIKMANNGEKI